VSKINCDADMRKYHAEEVTLKKIQQDEMRQRRKAGQTRLDNGLARDGYAQPSERSAQGSYAMKTMHQDDTNDYDIDEGIYFDRSDLLNNDGGDLLPDEARDRVCKALTDNRLKRKAIKKDNCVRQYYPEGYHIDMPVYRITKTKDADGQIIETYELASSDQWVVSDARSVTRWFFDERGKLNQKYDEGGKQLSRVTRITKKFARSRKSWKSSTTSGISLTNLVVDAFVYRGGRVDDAVRDTWLAIEQNLSRSTEIKHPVDTDRNLAEEPDEEVTFFLGCLRDALQDLTILDSESSTRAIARQAWNKVFKTTFFTDLVESNSDAKTAFSILTTGTAQRVGDGRFG